MRSNVGTKWWFALGQVAVAAGFNALRSGFYLLSGHRVFWIGPISTTILFVFLAIVFLVHCVWAEWGANSGSGRPVPAAAAYCGANAAWLAMMGFTVFVSSHPPYLKVTSTLGIAQMLTPVTYVPYLVVAYPAGGIAGWIFKKWLARNRNGET